MKNPHADPQLRVLILEDQIADAELCERELARSGLRFVSRRVDTLAQLEIELAGFEPDLVLSDFTFPGELDGLGALETVQRRLPGVPFIFVSGTIGEERAVEAMKHGAADYILKERMGRLGSAVRQVMENARLRGEVERAEAALRHSEARRAALISAALDCVITIDHEGSILEFNRAAELTFGYTAGEMLGKPVAARLIPESLRDSHRQGLARYLATRSSTLLDRRVETSAIRRDGSEFPIELAIVRVGADEPPVFTAFLRDITNRKLQERRIERLSRIRALSGGISAAIVRFGNATDLLNEACRIAVEHGGFEIAWAGRYDPATLDVIPVAWAGVGPEQFTRRSTSRADRPEGRGAIGQAIRGKEPVFVNDITLDSGVGGQRRKVAIERGFRSLTALPLVVDAEVIGHISLFAKEADFFNEEEKALLTELAANISLALGSMARQEKIARLSRIRAVTGEINAAIVRSRSKQVLFYEACRIAVEHGGFGIAWIGEFDAAAMEVKPVASAGLEETGFVSHTSAVRSGAPHGQSLIAAVIRERRAACNNDIITDAESGGNRRREAIRRGYRSAVALPLIVENKVTGTFSMFVKETNFFDDQEMALLTELAGNISFALESIVRGEKLEKLSRIREVSGEINAAIVRARSRQELFDEACRITVEAGRFPFVWLGTLDREAARITPAAWAGNEPGYLASVATPRQVGPGDSGVTADVVRDRKAAIVNDVQNDPRISRQSLHLEQGINSLAVFPLLVGDEVAGVLALHARERGFFDEEEVGLLFELVGDISFALQTIDRQERLDYLSYYDVLTGLPNRTLFIDRAGQQMRSRGGEPVMVALILVNLERFRNINEAFGRSGGDTLLTLAAERLEKAFRGKDYIARTGADGFGVVIRGIRDASAVVHIVEHQVLGCFHEPYKLKDHEVRVGAKVGIAMYPSDGEDADTLFRNAEAALKKGRESGERYLFYAADMNARAAQVLSLETRLRRAVEQRQFILHYQPKLGLGPGRGLICGLEALIRWQEPGGSLVAPGTFIPLLEETGLILDVGKWAIARALADHREWTAQGLAVPRIAVNVSAIQLQQRDFADMVIGTLHEQGDSPEALELEVTESLLMKDVDASIRKLSILRGVGIHIAMDDFGTGYSSLSYIARLPINSVKIDRSFIGAMSGNPHDMAIVTTIIALAHSLNLRVVAEGVETQEQSRLLALLKCDEAQGFLYSRPLPAADIPALLRAGPVERA